MEDRPSLAPGQDEALQPQAFQLPARRRLPCPGKAFQFGDRALSRRQMTQDPQPPLMAQDFQKVRSFDRTRPKRLDKLGTRHPIGQADPRPGYCRNMLAPHTEQDISSLTTDRWRSEAALVESAKERQSPANLRACLGIFSPEGPDSCWKGPEMTRHLAFAAPGRFWRGNLHTHSTRSDGVLSPEEVCRRYRAEGYDFLALTDHFIGSYGYPIVDTLPYRTNSFTTILGAELHSGAMANGELWHILAVGLPPDFAPSDSPDFHPKPGQETAAEIAARAVAAGAFVAVAHPQWSGLTLADARAITAAHAVEIYNHGCATGCDRPDGFAIADLLLTEGRKLSLIATDDAHFYEPDHFGGWVMVKAEENTPDALLAALKAGAFYSSQGPELRDVYLDGDHVVIESSAVVSAVAIGKGTGAKAVHGHSMTRSEVPLQRLNDSPWVRVAVIDAAGKRAWSNPIWR